MPDRDDHDQLAEMTRCLRAEDPAFVDRVRSTADQLGSPARGRVAVLPSWFFALVGLSALVLATLNTPALTFTAVPLLGVAAVLLAPAADSGHRGHSGERGGRTTRCPPAPWCRESQRSDGARRATSA